MKSESLIKKVVFEEVKRLQNFFLNKKNLIIIKFVFC